MTVDGVRAVTCRLAGIEAELEGALAADLGNRDSIRRLVTRITGIQRTIETAGPPGTRRARRRFRHASRELQAFIGVVSRGSKSGKISVGVGERVLARAADARGKILPLQKS